MINSQRLPSRQSKDCSRKKASFCTERFLHKFYTGALFYPNELTDENQYAIPIHPDVGI
jgi:hypothetical protein